MMRFTFSQHSLASIDSVRSDSSSWNEHVNDLSRQSYAPDNILPEEHNHVLRLRKPLNEIEPIASEGECVPDEQEQSTEEQRALCFMNRTWNQVSKMHVAVFIRVLSKKSRPLGFPRCNHLSSSRL